jgi:hypothetical protein
MALRLAGLDSLLVVPTAPPRLAQQVLQLESLQLRLARQVLQLEPLVALRLARHSQDEHFRRRRSCCKTENRNDPCH